MAVPDPWHSYRQQQEHLHRLLENPALKLIREQQLRIRDAIDPPALRELRERQQRVRDLIDPPALQVFRDQQSQLAALLDTPGPRAIRERPELRAEALNPDVLAAVGSYETSLATRVAAAAAEEDEASGTNDDVWFGAASWSLLPREIEGLLKALEILTAGLTAANMEYHVPPKALIAVLIVLVEAAEFALWLAKGD